MKYLFYSILIVSFCLGGFVEAQEVAEQNEEEVLTQKERERKNREKPSGRGYQFSAEML